MEKISEESLKKALETLGLEPDEAQTAAAADAAAAAAAPGAETELQKAEKEVALAQARVEALKNPTAQPLNKAEIIGEFKKDSADKFKAIATILKARDEKIEELTKAMNTQLEFSTALANRLGLVEKTPMPAKAIRGEVKYVERFSKGGDETGETGEKPTFSLSNPRQRGKVATLMLGEVKKAFDKGNGVLSEDDKKLQKAIAQVEIANVSDGAREMIQERLNIRLVR